MKREEETGPAGCDEDVEKDPAGCGEDVETQACSVLMRDRIRYFTGRHMTARDFRDADDHHRSYRHLHNRVLHGWGIACGLEVEPHPKPNCRPDHVLVRCGLAIDCCGREVVVPADAYPRPIDWKTEPETVSGPRQVLLLCLEYRERRTEKVPVLYSAEACSSPSMQDGRIREGYELVWRWVRRDELGTYGWRGPDGCPTGEDAKAEQGPLPGSPAYDSPKQEKPAPPDDSGADRPCPDEGSGKHPSCCLTPDCAGGHCVPLAVIRPEKPAEIDTSGRSPVQAGSHLTHICWISWPHGGLVKESELRSLRVRFHRPLAACRNPGRPGPVGINERTFVVQWGEQIVGRGGEDLDFVDWQNPPYLTRDRRTAVYEVRNPGACLNHVIHVTLRCDFILDCAKNPVDGDHLRGRLPTGNGLPGGTFESWFRVVSDADYDKTMKETDNDPAHT
jgi:hypothetical protein